MRLINLSIFSRKSGFQFEERWVTVDLHVHSVYSGGELTPGEILKSVQTALLDAVAICDHNEVKGALEAQSIGRSNPDYPLVIMGQEISAGDHFHFLLLGSRAPGEVSRNRLVEKVREHHDTGGAVILAHPWTMPKSSWAMGCLKDLITANLLDGVELFNSAATEVSKCSSEMRSFWEEWVAPNNLGVAGGSDFHYRKQGRSLGAGRTYLKILGPGEAGILEALRARRFVAGLFGPKCLNLDWIGSGTNLIFGAEPWFGELKQLRDYLRNYLEGSGIFDPNRKRFLVGMLEGGHFQLVRDLVFGY